MPLPSWRAAVLVAASTLVPAAPAGADTVHTDETIGSAVTWTAAGNDHIVVGTLSIAAAGSLTIEDGVIVRFDDAANMTANGTVNALGGVSGILFTRRDPTDEWKGLWQSPGSVGSYQSCTIEYATYGTAYGLLAGSGASLGVYDCIIRNCDNGVYTTSASVTLTGCFIADNGQYGVSLTGSPPNVSSCTISGNATGLLVKDTGSCTLSAANTIQGNTVAGLVIQNCTSPSVSNQTLTGNAGTSGAIFMSDTGSFHIGTGNTVAGNSWGLTISIGSYPDAASASNLPIAGNAHTDGIQVLGGTSSKSGTWRKLPADFVVTAEPTLAAGGTLTIEDGVVVKFDHSTKLNVRGALNAAGGASGILFTRRDPTDEWWGLWHYAGSSASYLHCTIERGTYSNGYGFWATGGALSVQDCIIRDCDNGLYASNTGPTIIRCRITGNSAYGIFLDGSSVPAFGTNVSEWNDVYGNGAGNSNRDLRNGAADVAAPYVYWGVADQSAVEWRVLHEPDNPVLGLVDYYPFTSAAHDTLFWPTGADGPAAPPTSFALSQSVPNPARSSAAISFALNCDGPVRLDVFDVAGRRVATLVDGFRNAGFHRVRWDTRAAAGGTYFYRLQSGHLVRSKRLVVVK